MTTEEITAKFGEPGSNQVMCNLPYRMKLAWDLNTTVSRFLCHKDVKSQLEAIFVEVLAHYGITQIQKLELDIFGGCLNVRQMVGGNRPSIHSWGLAVDLNPTKNQLKMSDKSAQFAKPEYIKFWEIVEKHGGFSLGRTKNYDWMHFQFIPTT